jgi:hypothetical protein
MPNWCTTTYYFKGNEDEIKKFYDFIEPFNYGGNLHKVCRAAGLTVNDEVPMEIDCRGEIGFIDILEGDHFEMDVVTAWCPAPSIWKAIIDHMELTSIKMAFESEEPGFAVYYMYDPDNTGRFSDRYLLVIYDEGKILECDHYTDDKADKVLKEINDFLTEKFKGTTYESEFKPITDISEYLTRGENSIQYIYNTWLVDITPDDKDCYFELHEFIIDNDISNYD